MREVMRFAPLLLLALSACQQKAAEQPAANEVPAAAPTPAVAPATASLTRYVDHYPFDKVGEGAGFLADPAVRAVVEGVVDDAEVRARVLDRDVTATPIALVDGRVLSFGCEPHNCGPHNWSVSIAPDGTSGRVCYFDEERKVARWYPADAGPEPDGGCPSGTGNN